MKIKQLLRKKFRDAVFERDGYKCVFCKETEKLDAHHITNRTLMPNGGYVKENGITLCPKHHLLAEHYHQSNGDKWYPDMHPEDLYEKIGSSYEDALKKSQKSS